MLSYSSRFFCFVAPTKLLVLRNLLLGVSATTLLISTMMYVSYILHLASASTLVTNSI
jgi:hypothetical protein